MIALLNIGRLLMVVWIGYGLVLIFSPALLHHAPDQAGGILQVFVAFMGGYLLDRALGWIHRRRALRAEESDSASTGNES